MANLDTADLLNVVCDKVSCGGPEDGPCSTGQHVEPCDVEAALDAVPNGWAKVGGRWVQFKTVNLGPED